jgi:hypothetical protein
MRLIFGRAAVTSRRRKEFLRALRDARQRAAEAKKVKKLDVMGNLFDAYRAVQGVLMMQARAGLMQHTLEDITDLDEFDLSGLPLLARTQFDLKAVASLIRKLPIERQITPLFSVSIAYSTRGDKVQARQWFDETRQVAVKVAQSKNSDPEKVQSAQLRAALDVFVAAHFLQDPELEMSALDELKALGTKYPSAELRPEELDFWPEFYDLVARNQIGLPIPLPTLGRIDEIARKLQNAKPSDLQFRALETTAGYYVFYKREDKLLPIAQAMVKTARALAPAEMKERNKRDTFFNPYWPHTPRMLNAIFWLQRAGDKATAATFAREFVRTTPDRERPYAAMSLTQLGFFGLADSLFDPAVEYSRIVAKRKEDWKRNRVDWSLFASWNEFAANEARYRAPDAPFRWIDHIDNNDTRAQILRSWIGALYPESRLKPPYVQVSGGRSSSSM